MGKVFRSWNDEAKGFRTKEISKKTLEKIISYSQKRKRIQKIKSYRKQ